MSDEEQPRTREPIDDVRDIVRRALRALIVMTPFTPIEVIGGATWAVFDVILDYLKHAAATGRLDESSAAAAELCQLLSDEVRQAVAGMKAALTQKERPTQRPKSGRFN